MQSPEPPTERKGPSKPALGPQRDGGLELSKAPKAKSVGRVLGGLRVLQSCSETCRKQFLGVLWRIQELEEKKVNFKAISHEKMWFHIKNFGKKIKVQVRLQ